MRQILFAALLCTAALGLSPAAHAALSTEPGAGGAMLIPTYANGTASVIPIQYYRNRHHHWRRHHHRRRHNR